MNEIGRVVVIWSLCFREGIDINKEKNSNVILGSNIWLGL